MCWGVAICGCHAVFVVITERLGFDGGFLARQCRVLLLLRQMVIFRRTHWKLSSLSPLIMRLKATSVRIAQTTKTRMPMTDAIL